MIEVIALTAALSVMPSHPDIHSRTSTTVETSLIRTGVSGERPVAKPFRPDRPTLGPAWVLPVLRRAAAIPHQYLSFARCVLDRESGGTLERIQSGVGARNPASSAAGRWQFLDRSWRSGLSHMVAERLIANGFPKAEGKKVRAWLAAHPIYQWHGYYQDTGFVAVVTAGGSHHWNGGSHSC